MIDPINRFGYADVFIPNRSICKKIDLDRSSLVQTTRSYSFYTVLSGHTSRRNFPT